MLAVIAVMVMVMVMVAVMVVVVGALNHRGRVWRCQAIPFSFASFHRNRRSINRRHYHRHREHSR
jgi:hypothetical protein